MMFVILILLLTHQILTLDLNIYKSVSEIRQSQSGIGKYEHTFSSDEYKNLIENSIDWSGTPFVKQEISKTSNTLKNTLVKVKDITACPCRTIEAEIIDPKTMLLKNKHTGHFFYSDSHSVEYVSKRPNDDGTILTIEFEKSNTKFNGTLSYLVQGINWTPNYNLIETNSDSCTLDGYANIQNNYQQEYQIDRTYLYSSDPQLVYTHSITPIVYRAIATAVQTNSTSSLIQSNGEEKGFYSYSLNTKYTLGPTSSIRLPFITTKLHCEFYYLSTLYISTAELKGAFQRAYDLTSNQFLPGGLLAVRNSTFLIGQVTLADMPNNSTQIITLGQDPDVQYVVNTNLTATKKENTKVTSQSYSIDVSISNYKAKVVKGELKLYGTNPTNIQNSTCNSMKLDGNQIHFPFSLTQKATFHCHFLVTLNFL